MEFETKVIKKNISSIFSNKDKKKQVKNLFENLYFVLRRIFICIKYFFFNLFHIEKINSKFIKVKILDKQSL